LVQFPKPRFGIHILGNLKSGLSFVAIAGISLPTPYFTPQSFSSSIMEEIAFRNDGKPLTTFYIVSELFLEVIALWFFWYKSEEVKEEFKIFHLFPLFC
jgi:hypothetical protein